jgi:DNA polymerase-4
LIPDRDKVAFLQPLPVRVIPGVGRVTEEVLQRAGMHTLGDLQKAPGDLRDLVGSFGLTLKELAFGEDDRAVDTSDDVKSISSEETFDSDTNDRKILRNFLRSSANELSDRLKQRRLAAHTVQVKVRYSDFTTLTRQISTEEPIIGSTEIYRLACHLLARHKLVGRPLRLLGLGVSGLVEPVAEQLMLLP